MPRRRRPPLPIPAAAEYAGTNVRHIRQLVSGRVLPSTKLGGKVLIAPDDIDALLAANRREKAS